LVEDLLRKYRPVGPPADLRARTLVPERAAWPWAVAAAALLVVTVGFHLATRTLDAHLRTTETDAFGFESRIAYAMAALGGGDEARGTAMAIVLEEEILKDLPPVSDAPVTTEDPR
jgi:hypothetical protein